MDGDDEDVFTAGLVPGIGILLSQEHLVLNSDGMQIAAPGTHEGRLDRLFVIGKGFKSVWSSFGAPEALFSWEEKLFPTVRTHVVSEIGVILAPTQPILSLFLLIGPTLWQVLQGLQLIKNDGLISKLWADKTKARSSQNHEEFF